MSGKGNGIGMTVPRALVGLAITFPPAAAVADAAQTPASARLTLQRLVELTTAAYRDAFLRVRGSGLRLDHFLNDSDSPDIPIPIYVGYLNRIRDMAMEARP